ncbi:methyltransferase domain-containing protein [Patescibacteria group bacterium]|nr:methyltransferase domain-containing protein [Patescibacteria group bacterium]
MRGRSVLEFGCNSGENALVLAHYGANLTLVEPNMQVIPRLKYLFKRFNLEKNIVELCNDKISDFESRHLYDLVLAEGFLFTLSNRDEMLKKICGLLKPEGFGIISFNDKYGNLLELTRYIILWKACALAKIGINDSLDVARQLYEKDFARINTSRSFEEWWKDGPLNPSWTYSWSYEEILSLLNNARFYSSSPKWTSLEHFRWYKDVSNGNLLEEWKNYLPFFLTGCAIQKKASPEVTKAVSDFTTGLTKNMIIDIPLVLDKYLKACGLRDFASEIKAIVKAMKTADTPDKLIATYHKAKHVRTLWGAPYSYLCFCKDEKDE